jgi:uncharacterized protein YecT (DUF1311 family)
MAIYPYLFFISLLCVTSAQSYAADNCGDPKTQLDMNVCADKEYKREDAALNNNYKQLVRELGPSAKNQLKAAQLAWIKFRDLQCEYEASRYEGGSMKPYVYLMCLTEVTKQRNKDFRSMIEGFPR